MKGGCEQTETALTQCSLLRFAELDTTQLYQLLQLRVDVFVVEQNCAYRELDGLDTLPGTLHLLACCGQDLVAYARVLAPDAAGSQGRVRIGRVVVHPEHRQRGLSRSLLQKLITAAQSEWPGCELTLSAQSRLLGFYQSLGFTPTSDEYLEDGIAHIDMNKDGAPG